MPLLHLACGGDEGGNGDGGAPSAEVGRLPECESVVAMNFEGRNGFVTDNDCTYSLSYEGGETIGGTCNLEANAVSSADEGVSYLLFQGGTSLAEVPFEHIDLTFTGPGQEFESYEGFHYELGDTLAIGTHLDVTYSHASQYWGGANVTGLLSDEEAIVVKCSVTQHEEERTLIEGDAIEFRIDEVTPVCRAADDSDAVVYEVHGRFVGNCQGRFGVSSASTERSVRVEISF